MSLLANGQIDTRNQAISEQFRGRRVVHKTKQAYMSKLNNVKAFFLTDPVRYGRYLDENVGLIVPFQFDDLKQLFGWLSVNTDIPMQRRSTMRRTRSSTRQGADSSSDDDTSSDGVENEERINNDRHPNDEILALSQQTMSISSYQAHKSAIVWLYKEKNISLPTEEAIYLDDVICGYRKISG